MAATLQFDQSGQPAGTPGVSRKDIVAGTPVKITNVAPGAANALAILAAPFADDTWTVTGADPTYYVTPKVGTSGRWRVRLTVDSVVTIRTFTILTPGKGLEKPAPMELADPDADLTNATDPAIITASETNEPDAVFPAGNPFGYFPALDALFDVVDASVDGKDTIDNKSMAGLVTTGDGDQACAVAIQTTPLADGYVRVMVNGQAVVLGDGDKLHDCYFSGDGGTTPRAIADVVAGDVLFWNGSIAGFQLAASDILSFDYTVTV